MVLHNAAHSLLGTTFLLAALLVAPFVHAQQASAPGGPPLAFAETTITLRNGVVGRTVAFPSANPRNYEDIVQRRELPSVTLQAKLFTPRRQGRVPAVIIAPGSGGVNSSMLMHANALVDAGIAVLLFDPFGGRGISDTTRDQLQLSQAASSYDVLAAMRALTREGDIDSSRIGAMGYSRGGIAVLNASVTSVAEGALGSGKALRAVLAAWPWCGWQFTEPRTAPTAVRFLVGDIDNWVGPVQCQAYFSAMKPRNQAVSLRMFRNADHGFGNERPMREIPDTVKAPTAPILYFDERGVMLDPWSGQPRPGDDDRAAAAGFEGLMSRGAVRVGTKDNQVSEFVADFVAFFSQQLTH